MGILRTRNMLLIVVAVYATMTVGMVTSELSTMSKNISSIKETVRLAADSAVSQAMASDEFFNDGEGDESAIVAGANALYRTKGVTSVRTAATPDPKLKSYTNENLFEMVYGFNTDATDEATVNAAKVELYQKMFGLGSGSVLQNASYMSDVCKIVTDMPSLVAFGGNGKLPNIARLGLLEGSSLGVDGESAYLNLNAANALRTTVKSAVGNLTTENTVYDKYNTKKDWLKLLSVVKSYEDSSGNEHQYMLAPTNVGITYVDPFVLETAFVSNMDLLMRGDMPNLAQGLGIVSNGYSGNAQVVNSDYVNDQFIINNGKFSFVKGQLKDYSSPSMPGGWTGGVTKNNIRVVPKIEYKLVNACDTSIENIKLMHLAVGLPDSVMNGNLDYSAMKAGYEAWLRDIGIEDITKPHYLMVARISFFADVFVSYNTSIARDLYNMFVKNEYNYPLSGSLTTQIGDTNNALFQVRDGIGGTNELTASDPTYASVQSAITDLPYYVYTTYYAVMP